MEGWKGSLLNQAGKEILIKVVIQAIPTYIMSILSLPKTFCKSLLAAVARFWWRSYGKSRGIHWSTFNKLCLPKDQGGLGFKEFNKLNLALLSKQVSRLIQEPTSYWGMMIKAIYYPNSDIWHAGSPTGASWVWKSPLKGCNFLKENGRWSMGDGSKISITEDLWLASGSRAILRTDNTANLLRYVSELLNTNHQWDTAKLRSVLTPVSAIEAIQTLTSWLG